MKKLINFFKEEDGATAVEYALMVAAIAVTIIIAVFFLGNVVANNFNDIGTKLENAGN